MILIKRQTTPFYKRSGRAVSRNHTLMWPGSDQLTRASPIMTGLVLAREHQMQTGRLF
jgi:hypothetical protein